MREWIVDFGKTVAKGAERVFPDPFVVAVILALVTTVAAVGIGTVEGLSFAPLDGLDSSVRAWYEGTGETFAGMWTLLEFAMQMTLILVLGSSLAKTPTVSRFISAASKYPSSSAEAAWFIAFCACAVSLVHWGLGLIVGATLAKGVARHALLQRNRHFHYPLLAAAGYSGLMVWHGGLTGSGPLKAASGGAGAILDVPVPLTETIFSPLNVVVSGLALIVIPWTFRLLAPDDPNSDYSIDQYLSSDKLFPAEESTATKAAMNRTLANKLEREWTWLKNTFVALLGGSVVFIVTSRVTEGGALTVNWLNAVNGILFAVALLFHEDLITFVESVRDSMSGAADIAIQFPLYAGIVGVMSQAGFVQLLSEWYSGASAELFPIVTMIGAGIVNVFIPSGGGQYMVQGPILEAAAEAYAVGDATWIMAMAYGDQLTNMIQPFWALALLAITGLRARDIMGYCMIVMIIAWIVVFTVPLLVVT